MSKGTDLAELMKTFVPGVDCFEVAPMDGAKKVEVVKEILLKTPIFDIMYVGSNKTDVEALGLVKKGGGLPVSFNGNCHTVRTSGLVVLSSKGIVNAAVAYVFDIWGTLAVLGAVDWPNNNFIKNVDTLIQNRVLLESLRKAYPNEPPIVERVTPTNVDDLCEKSNAFMETIRVGIER